MQKTESLKTEDTKPSGSPSPDEDDSDAGKYMMFHRSDDETDDQEGPNVASTENNHENRPGPSHIIPKSPDESSRRWDGYNARSIGRACISMRGRGSRTPTLMPYRTGGHALQSAGKSYEAAHPIMPTPSGGEGEGDIESGARLDNGSAGHEYQSAKLSKIKLFSENGHGRSLTVPSWGSTEDNEKCNADATESYSSLKVEENMTNVITPAHKYSRKGSNSPGAFVYPPSSPIATDLPPDASPESKPLEELLSEEGGEEWLPPQSNSNRVRGGATNYTAGKLKNEIVARPRTPQSPTIKLVSSAKPSSDTALVTQPTPRPQFVRNKPAQSSTQPSRQPARHNLYPSPPLVVDSSQSNDSFDFGSNYNGGRVQVVGGGIGKEWNVDFSRPPWYRVSHSHSTESGASGEWEPPRAGISTGSRPSSIDMPDLTREVTPSRQKYQSYPSPDERPTDSPPDPSSTLYPQHAYRDCPPPSDAGWEEHPYEMKSDQPIAVHSTSFHTSNVSTYPNPEVPQPSEYPQGYYSSREHHPPKWQNPSHPPHLPRTTEGGYPPPPDSRYDFSYNSHYPYSPYFPRPYSLQDAPCHNGTKDKNYDEETHPLLKDYNPHRDSVRPQFRNMKKGNEGDDNFSARGKSSDPTRATPVRKRRRRKPTEKAAAAAAMAAAATAAAAAAKERRAKLAEKKTQTEAEGEGSTDGGKKEDNEKGNETEDELNNLDPGDDEELPAAKRAAIASAVALRAAAGGSPLEPPKAAAEVDFDIADPPLEPIHPPSVNPVLESTTLMAENDVLCGRGGGTNSQMGNRRFRALVRDFQPTYLMARRREKPLMARSVVLIVRNRGGRFLRRDDADGRLYEVGDEKAEAKTSQALREGLDVRATKTAANTLMGTDGSKKRTKRGNLPKDEEGAEKADNSAINYDDAPSQRSESSVMSPTDSGDKQLPPVKMTHCPPSEKEYKPSPHYPEPLSPRGDYDAHPPPYGPPAAGVPPPQDFRMYYPHPPHYENSYRNTESPGYHYQFVPLPPTPSRPPPPTPSRPPPTTIPPQSNHHMHYHPPPYPYPTLHFSAPGIYPAYPYPSPARSSRGYACDERHESNAQKFEMDFSPPRA